MSLCSPNGHNYLRSHRENVGWHGLVVAKTYLQIHPKTHLAIFESSSELGGVWSPSRCYPSLKTNNQLGTFHYGDFPMSEAQFGVKHGEHIPGRVVHEYFLAYAKHFGFYDYIHFNSKVETAECKESNGWLLSVSTTTRESGLILARKLIIATGLTSQPFGPKLPGIELFQAPFIHSKDVAQRDQDLQKMSDIVVLGNNKSAYDAAYAYASRGTKVHLVIRESGKGPLWMFPAFVTPLKIWTEKLISTRLLGWFSPCVWGDADGHGTIRWLLSNTLIGRLLMSLVWMILTKDVEHLLDFNHSPETKRLRPWTPPFWHGTGISVVNYDGDFQGLVRDGKIEVHISDVEMLSKNKVHLQNGAELKADGIIAATGWSHAPSVKFLPSGIEARLGLPGHGSVSDDEAELERLLSKQTDAEILRQFPILKNQPASTSRREISQHSRPWRLFRFIIPPAFVSHRTIAFAGMLLSLRTATTAELQALWIASFLDGSLDVENCLKHFSAAKSRIRERESLFTRVLWDTMLMTQFGRWRCPSGWGDRFPDFAFDCLPYFDLLLGDLGLKKQRKKGWLADAVEQNVPEDYGGVVEEWITLQKKSL